MKQHYSLSSRKDRFPSRWMFFVGLNIGLGTILQSKLDEFKSLDSLTIYTSIIGLIINIFWLGTFRSNNRYYAFRMAQAR